MGTYFQLDNVVLPSLSIMWAQTLLFAGVLYFIEVGQKKLRAKSDSKFDHAQSRHQQQPHTTLTLDGEAGMVVDGEDTDVSDERTRAMQSGPSNAVFRVQRLRRVFYDGGWMCLKPSNVKVAVKDLSFCVGEGEVFGLLGPNGMLQSDDAMMQCITYVHTRTSRRWKNNHHLNSDWGD